MRMFWETRAQRLQMEKDLEWSVKNWVIVVEIKVWTIGRGGDCSSTDWVHTWAPGL